MYFPIQLARNVRSTGVMVKVHTTVDRYNFFLTEIWARCDGPEPLLEASTVKMLNNSHKRAVLKSLNNLS